MSKKPTSSDDRFCGNCDREEEKMFKCSRCGLVKYCGKDCQRAHWKEHKPFCIAKADRVPQPPVASLGKSCTEEATHRDMQCAICLDPLGEEELALKLPCDHVFHGSCVVGLRARGVAKVCPLCRADLPPGPEKLLEEATRRYFVVEARIKRQYSSWHEAYEKGALSASEQQEVHELGQLYRSAASQGSPSAQRHLGYTYLEGVGVPVDHSKALKWYRKRPHRTTPNHSFRSGTCITKAVACTRTSLGR